MKLAIIIPCHNNAKSIIKTIDSIYKSSHINKYNFEIIIVDDFSLDGSSELIKKKFPTVRIYKLKNQSGAAKARNIGIEKAQGNVLIFIDGDAWFNTSTINTLVKNLDRKTDIVFPKIMYENGHILYPVLTIEKSYPHISGCFLIKKDSLKKLDENFDEFYETYLEDYDFFIRCKLSRLTAKYVKDARVIHADKEHKDYSERYYLEARNTLYGIIKLGKYAKRSKLYNPFDIKTLFKIFIFGIFNFAWFDWQHYDRSDKNFRILFSKKKTKISVKNTTIHRIYIYLKAIIGIILNLKRVFKKRKKFQSFIQNKSD